MLHQEAGLANELSGPLGENTTTAVTTLLGLGGLLLVVLLLFRSRDSILQDGVEVGLDVVGIGLLVILGVVVVIVALGFDGGRSVVFLPVGFNGAGVAVVVKVDGEVIVHQISVDQIVIVELGWFGIVELGWFGIFEILEIDLFLEQLVVFSHGNPL